MDMDQFFAAVEQTFESDISENAAVTIHLYHTVLELVRRIEKNDFEGRTLTLKVKFLDFQQITRSITVDHILRTKDEINKGSRSTTGRLLKQEPAMDAAPNCF